MQNERNVLTTERFEEPQQSDVFVPCPIAWNVSAAARPLCLWIQSVRELGKKHRGVPTPTPRSRGGNDNVNEWTTYPRKTPI